MRIRHKIQLKSYLIDCHTVKTSKEISLSPLKVMGLDDKIKPYKHLKRGIKDYQGLLTPWPWLQRPRINLLAHLNTDNFYLMTLVNSRMINQWMDIYGKVSWNWFANSIPYMKRGEYDNKMIFYTIILLDCSGITVIVSTHFPLFAAAFWVFLKFVLTVFYINYLEFLSFASLLHEAKGKQWPGTDVIITEFPRLKPKWKITTIKNW